MAVSAYAVARSAARAAERTAGVVALDPGPLGSFSTYGDGQRCPGVTVTSSAGALTVGVRLVAAFDTVLPELAAAVRAAVRAEVEPIAEGRALVVDIDITDLASAAAG